MILLAAVVGGVLFMLAIFFFDTSEAIIEEEGYTEESIEEAGDNGAWGMFLVFLSIVVMGSILLVGKGQGL
jgi:hypothetical protein